MAQIAQKRYWFTPEEKNLLVSIIAKYNDVILNKKTDAATNHRKNNAWAAVSREYNALWVSSVTKRTSKQLKKCWEAMKFKKRREMNHQIGAMQSGALIIESATSFDDLPVTIVKEENESSLDEATAGSCDETVENSCASSVATFNVDMVKAEAVDFSDTIQSAAMDIPPAAIEIPLASSPILSNPACSASTDLHPESCVADALQEADVQLPAEHAAEECGDVTAEDSAQPKPKPKAWARTARRNNASRDSYLRLAAKELWEQQKEERILLKQLYRAKLLAVRRESRMRLSLLKAQRRHCCYRRQRACDTSP